MNVASDQLSFDVSVENAIYVKDRRGGRWLLLVAALFLSTIIVGISVKIWLESGAGRTLGTFQIAEYIVFLIAFGVPIGVALLDWRLMDRGADRVVVDSQGIGLLGPGERADRLRWQEWGLSFDLRDWSAQPLVSNTGVSFYLAIPWGRTHALSRKAFESILSAADSRGLVMADKRAGFFWWSAPPVVYRIRGRGNRRTRETSGPSGL